jgi:hypothetical protein
MVGMTNTRSTTDHPMTTSDGAFVVAVLFDQHGASAWHICKRMTDADPGILDQLPPSQEHLVRAWLSDAEDEQATAEVSTVVGISDLGKQLGVVGRLSDHGNLQQHQIDALHGIENLLSDLKRKAEAQQ